MLHEAALDVRGSGVVKLCLIVDLEADHALAVCGVLQKLNDDPLRMPQVRRGGDVHDLARTVSVLAGTGHRQYFRMRLDQPCRHRIGRCPDDHANASVLHGIKDTIHMREVENARLRFARGLS